MGRGAVGEGGWTWGLSRAAASGLGSVLPPLPAFLFLMLSGCGCSSRPCRTYHLEGNKYCPSTKDDLDMNVQECLPSPKAGSVTRPWELSHITASFRI